MNNSVILWHNFVGIFFLHLINDLIIYTHLSFIKVSSMNKWQHSNIHRSSKIARPHQGFSAMLPVAWLKVLKSSQPFSTRHVTVCQFILKSKNTLWLRAWSRTINLFPGSRLFIIHPLENELEPLITTLMTLFFSHVLPTQQLRCIFQIITIYK